MLVFTDEPKQKMLGLNGRATELTRFVPSKEDDPARSFCVSLKHWIAYFWPIPYIAFVVRTTRTPFDNAGVAVIGSPILFNAI